MGSLEIPCLASKALPYFTFICPKCKKEVKSNSHQCPRCNEKYPLVLTGSLKGFNTEALGLYVHEKIFPRITEAQRQYLKQYFTVYVLMTLKTTRMMLGLFATVVTTNETIAESTRKAEAEPIVLSHIKWQLSYKNSYFYYTANLAEFYARVYVYISSHNATANGDLILFDRGRQSTNLWLIWDACNQRDTSVVDAMQKWDIIQLYCFWGSPDWSADWC